ncbi:hypothetical protein [Bradyrhizobium sp. Tv2a-2]|uniref:hypothetical protein n=1 Tax=Bradyrhizobium sp. Tv2a-2 TaxID=113395 RepID=UPI000427EF40|nr:hypothetical protein [Bradyrhizobium sp. Tv2a-2]
MVDRYIVRGAGPHKLEWAFIYLDEETGVFSAYTSFGTYAYCWSHIGTATLKEFLSDIEFGYFMGKTIGRRDYMEFDFHATIKGMKDYIKERRRDGAVDKVEARDAWDDVERIENRQSVELFVEDVYDSRPICHAYRHDFDEVIRNRPSPQCVGFWQVIWPEFLKQIAPPPSPAPRDASQGDLVPC